MTELSRRLNALTHGLPGALYKSRYAMPISWVTLAFFSNGWRREPQTWRHAGNRAVAEPIEQADSTFPAVVA